MDYKMIRIVLVFAIFAVINVSTQMAPAPAGGYLPSSVDEVPAPYVVRGNRNVVKTVRSVTTFNKLIMGRHIALDHPTIRSATPIEINIQLSESSSSPDDEENGSSADEMTIMCDQNLQKYFVVESNGDYLNIRMENEDDEENGVEVINASQPIKINIKSTKPSLFINKRNHFSQVDLTFEPISRSLQQLTQQTQQRDRRRKRQAEEEQDPNHDHDTTALLDCEGDFYLNSKHVKTSIFNVKKLATRSHIFHNYLRISMCAEQFSFYVYHNSRGYQELLLTRNKKPTNGKN